MHKRAPDRRSLSHRRFMAYGGTAAAEAWLVESGRPIEAAQSIPVTSDYDVIVCGGGTSGIPAAIAADPRLFNKHTWYGGSASRSRLDCAIGDAVIFNRALSAEEIVQLATDSDGDGAADFWEPVTGSEGGGIAS